MSARDPLPTNAVFCACSDPHRSQETTHNHQMRPCGKEAVGFANVPVEDAGAPYYLKPGQLRRTAMCPECLETKASAEGAAA